MVTIVAVIVLVGGLWAWMRFVPSDSVVGAFMIGQITLFLLLIPRFWQRGIAVSYWQQKMLAPAFVITPLDPAPIPAAPVPIAPVPEPGPIGSSASDPDATH